MFYDKFPGSLIISIIISEKEQFIAIVYIMHLNILNIFCCLNKCQRQGKGNKQALNGLEREVRVLTPKMNGHLFITLACLD